ncbi:PadR family transcriptional regulator [Brevibacillus borstelensis]|uniref:PadR family transcriptional regulator n=1 Tax=Brevibacillus borstelensis TaxID=45462 RepID=UPI0030C05025
MEGGDQELNLRHRHGGSRGGFGGRGEGKRRFFERGEFKFALLELLASTPMHGYQLIKAMEGKTNGYYTPSAGSIYPNLQMLEEMELVVSSEEDGKKLYHITDKGKECLQERRSRTVHPEERWKRQGRHRLPDKRDLHDLMEDWPEVLYLMGKAARAAQEDPASKQASEFKEMMVQLQNSLLKLLSADEGPQTAASTLPDGHTEDKG